MIFPVGNIDPEVNKCLDYAFQGHGLRSSVRDDKHIHTESILKSGLFIKDIADILRVRSLFQLDDDPDSFF